LGFTTDAQLWGLEKALTNRDITIATLAHKQTRLEKIFQMSKFAWDNLDDSIKKLYDVKYDNVRELSFSATGSKLYVALDLRGDTIHHLHISELNFMKDLQDKFAESLEAVPKNGTITIESTANGLNAGYDVWRDAVEGKNEFTPHFYNWTWDESYIETPPESNSWKDDYKFLAKKYNLISNLQQDYQLSDPQFYWYYLKVVRLKEKTKQEYPTIPEEAFLSSSVSVFDLYGVSQLKAVNPVTSLKGVDIFEEPIKDHKYIIGCDTAEGTGGDSTSIEIWDLTDAENIKEVGSFADSMIRPDQTADMLVSLGRIYNDAFLIPERNGSGLSTVLKIQDKGYRNLFVNKTIDKQTQKSKHEYGWRTKGGNRDLMIDDFVELFEEGKLIINSQRLIQEMKTFVRKDNGRREHDEGYHDDCLFASFLAIQGNKYHRTARAFSSKAKVF
jgi:hypothetical protein